ncbi:hypothetical protein EJ05DRAFT_504556 [Pseudovirgaria hyperparasitica]|uniref:DUF4048 domain-containing protein n=1 Tax=Pseudovirgaria hyperparasitica TaxID=470096 RepID=A0A6A6VVR8_9PEZI|nr:uncharacterized protein EJ05DRAFT_504556 [Pseudovirgaria hyperparasitica]KAF2753959.1 hypothetical protein EJ05DRAFT_504556 [Pseudovirgaria hyperparasitica]
MESDSYARAKSGRRHTIAPIDPPQLAPSTSGASKTNSATATDRTHPLHSPATSDTVSPSLPSHSNRSSTIYEQHGPTTDRQSKRLSLNFPIQPPDSRPRPQSWMSTATPVLPSPEIPEPLPSPTSGNFLTSLAAQERRVLELREELHKAESQLGSLKKQWALHEVHRKRTEVRTRTQSLLPLNTLLSTVPSPVDDSDGQSWMQKDLERRRTLLSAPKQPTRTVFSGSRHTRQLSLLSPDTSFTPSFRQPSDLLDDKQETSDSLVQPLTRSLTVSDVPKQQKVSDDGFDAANAQGEAILRQGKKMATDFKDGLWTFIDDLRQATVGEEAANTPQSRTKQSTQTSRNNRQSNKGNMNGPKNGATIRPQSWAPQKTSSDALIDIGGSFWKEHGLDEPKTSGLKKNNAAKHMIRTPQKSVHQAVDDQGESWDSWETPNEKHIGRLSSNDSGSEGRSTPRSARSTPRTSTSSTGDVTTVQTPVHGRNDSITWPTLDKLSPTNLKRTASHLMREWEKSLTPTAESRDEPSTGEDVDRSVACNTGPSRKAD